MKTDMKDQDLTEKIIGCALKVHNTLAFGFLEKLINFGREVQVKRRVFDRS